jgi:hypothetical protein
MSEPLVIRDIRRGLMSLADTVCVKCEIHEASGVELVTSEVPKEKSVLLEAHDIVSKRNDAYGEPTDTCERVSTAFSTLTKRQIKPADVALIQMLFKVVRSEHGYKRDNNVDLAGYTDIRERCLLKEMDK